MSFWKPIQILLRVRLQVARTKLAANPTTTLWIVLILVALLPVALSIGTKVGATWSELSSERAEANLDHLWLEMQIFWLLAVLFPSGIALLGQIPPRSTLRSFDLRPIQVFVAEVGALLLDAPTLLACLLTFPLLCALLLAGQWLQGIVTLSAFTLLSLQTGLCARLLTYLCTLGAQRVRRLTAIPGITAFLLISLCAGIPPAFASLTSPKAQHFLPAHRPAASPFLGVQFTSLLPSHSAAQAVVATRQGDYGAATRALGSVAGWLVFTAGTAFWALRGADRSRGVGESPGVVVPRAPPGFPRQRRSHTGSVGQIAALVQTEWRLLLRTPQNFLPLRKPASLLLLGVFAFLAPDMGRNPVANILEFLAIGTLLYSVLWQLQLLCNRFGNEAGTATLLFGFSIPRRRLLLGKNIALFGLLLLVDSPVMIGMAFVSEVPEYIGLFLRWLPLILLTLTSFGNLISVLCPFSIQRQERQGGSEPPDSLAWAYPLIGAATVVLLTPIAALTSHGMVGWIGAVAILSALYVASLYGAGALLARHEVRMLAALDRGDLSF